MLTYITRKQRKPPEQQQQWMVVGRGLVVKYFWEMLIRHKQSS